MQVGGGRRLGGPLWFSKAFLPTPLFVPIFTYITPDRFSLFVGALVLLVGKLWWHRRLNYPWLAIAGTISGGLFKQTFIAADIGLLALIIGLSLQSRHLGMATRNIRELVFGMSSLFLGSCFGLLCWQMLKNQWGVDLPPRTGPDLFTIVPDLDGALGILFRSQYQTPLGDNTVLMLEPFASYGLASLLTLATSGASFGAIFFVRLKDRIFPFALAAVFTSGLGGLIISILGAASSGNWLPPSPRYLLAAFPVIILPLLLLARRRVVWISALAVLPLALLAWSTFPMA